MKQREAYQRKAWDVVQTVLLFALLILMLGLTTVISMQTMGVKEVQFRSLFSLLPWMDDGYTVRTAERPMIEPVRWGIVDAEGNVHGFVRNAEGRDAFAKIAPVIGAGLSKAGTWQKAQAIDLQNALQKNAWIAEYDGAISLALLASTLDATVEQGGHLVQSLIFTQQGDLFVRERDTHQLWKAKTERPTWETIELAQQGKPRVLGQMVSPHFAPETLIAKEPLRFPIYQVEQTGWAEHLQGDTLQHLLEAFSYNPQQAAYQEGDAAQVFVGDFSTLRMDATGQLMYEQTASEGGISLTQSFANNRALDQLQLAQQIHTAVLSSVESASASVVLQVQEDEKHTTILLGEMAEGILIGEQQAPLVAQFVFSEDRLVSARIPLRHRIKTEEQLYVIPPQIAILTVDNGTYSYQTAYEATEGRMLPTTYLAP